MNRLPQPKEVKVRKPWTTLRQLQYGIIAYLVCHVVGEITENAIFTMLGIWLYAASFSLFPIVPEHLKGKDEVIKKFKRNLRVVAVIISIFALSKLWS